MPIAIAATIMGLVAVFGFSRVAHAYAVTGTAVASADLQQRAESNQFVYAAGGQDVVYVPSIITAGVSNISKSSARLTARYDSRSPYAGVNEGYVSFEYGTSANNLAFTSKQMRQHSGSRPVNIDIEGLNTGTTYYYRAVLQYDGGALYGQIKSFSTSAVVINTAPTSSTSTGSTTNNGNSSSNTNTGSSNNNGSSSNNSNSSSNANSGTSSSNSSTASGTATNSFARLSITDNETRIERGDEVTYVVTYEARQALQDAELVIELPAGMVISDTTRGKIGKDDATVTVDLGDLAAGAKRTIEIDARLNKNYQDGKDLGATAELSFEASNSARSLTATDTTEFSGDSNLGASIFGTGVSMNLFQWILVAGLLAAIIILARKQFAKA